MGTSNRRTAVVVLGSLALVVLLFLIAENAFNLKFLSPENSGSILFFTALSGISFLLFLMLVVLLVRNILKLYASEQSRVLGSRLRARMLLGALILSVVPAFFMLSFNYLLMNRSIDRWFSQPVVQLRDESMQLAMEMSRYAADNARAEAESLAHEPEVVSADLPAHPEGCCLCFVATRSPCRVDLSPSTATEKSIDKYQFPSDGGTVSLLSSIRPNEQAQVMPEEVALSDEILQAAERTDDPILRIGQAAYSVGDAPAQNGVVVVVGLPLPPDVGMAVRDIASGTERYWTLLRARRRVRQTYLLVLLLLTGLTLFVSSWLALFLSKQVTRPVEALADAMDAMASGDYGSRVDIAASGELGELMRSFNHMATDLENSRTQLESSTYKLSEANAAIDERRRELETVLETIPSGVATLDNDLRILQANRAFCEMLDPLGELPIEGQPIQSLFQRNLLLKSDASCAAAAACRQPPPKSKREVRAVRCI